MTSHPIIHFLHDAGAAAWFGGSLMGATSLNAAAAELDDPRERARVSTAGWSRWAPANTAAVAAHVIGGAGLMITDWERVRTQEGVGRSTAIKAGVTGAALGVAAWSAALNRKMAAAGPVPVQGATEPSAATPPDVARTQSQLKLVQWLNPLLAGAIVGLGSWHEEQQRTSQQVPGLVKGLTGRPARAAARPRRRRRRPGRVAPSAQHRHDDDAHRVPGADQHSAVGHRTTGTSTGTSTGSFTAAGNGTGTTVGTDTTTGGSGPIR